VWQRPSRQEAAAGVGGGVVGRLLGPARRTIRGAFQTELRKKALVEASAGWTDARGERRVASGDP
jgi:hypothetical protein